MPRPGYLTAVVLVVLHISGPICGNQLPGPRDVHFSSWNLNNTLLWKPGEGAANEVEYIVQYKRYGTEGWLNKLECSNTRQTSCDLSDETYEHEEQYYARVMAVWNNSTSSWVETERFNPLISTTIGPPSVKVSSGERSLLIKLTAPKRFKGRNETKAMSLVQIYPDLEYNVSIMNTRTNSTRIFLITNKTWNESRLDPNTTYCVTVQPHVRVLKKFGVPSERVCATTVEDHTARLMILILFGCILPAGFVVLVILGVGCFVYKYMFVSKQQQPRNLLLPHPLEFKKNYFVPCDNITVKFITLNIDNVKSSWNAIDLQKGAGNNLKVIKDTTGMTNESHEETLAVHHLGYASQKAVNSSLRNEVTKNNNICNTECSHIQSSTNEESLDYGIVLRASDVYAFHGQELRPSKDTELCATGNTCKDISLKALNNMQPSPINKGLQNESMTPQLTPMKWGLQMRTELQKPMDDGNRANNEESTLKAEEEEEEEEETVIVDWDPHTHMLYIPTLPTLRNNAYEEDDDSEKPDSEQESQVGLLSKLYMKQTSEEPSEDEEICLIKFKEDWGLHVQMEE